MLTCSRALSLRFQHKASKILGFLISIDGSGLGVGDEAGVGHALLAAHQGHDTEGALGAGGEVAGTHVGFAVGYGATVLVIEREREDHALEGSLLAVHHRPLDRNMVVSRKVCPAVIHDRHLEAVGGHLTYIGVRGRHLAPGRGEGPAGGERNAKRQERR